MPHQSDQLEFIPFAEIDDKTAIVVDGRHARGLILSHWRGANTHPAIAADTSAGIVLNAIRANVKGLELPYVTATHFDIDGFVGVWSLFNPAAALQHANVLEEMAVIADFRELDLQNPASDTALKLVCWINSLEAREFYRPYGAEELEQSELHECPAKFAWFLPRFAAVLANPDEFQDDWQAEYNQVLEDLELLNRSYCQRYPGCGLTLIRAERPLHYYALFGASIGADIVLSQYDGHKYELEYKYTTWVDIVSRPVLPRLSLKPLCEYLNSLERNQYTWMADKITDTGPQLRLEDAKLNKATRYANPFERPVYQSSIEPDKFLQTVLQYLSFNYQDVQAKRFWTWQEMHVASQTAELPSAAD